MDYHQEILADTPVIVPLTSVEQFLNALDKYLNFQHQKEVYYTQSEDVEVKVCLYDAQREAVRKALGEALQKLIQSETVTTANAVSCLLNGMKPD